MVKRRSGFSLLELMIGLALLSVVSFALLRLFVFANRGMNDASRAIVTQSSLGEAAAMFKKFLSPGDSRFYAFSGRGALGDRPLVRVLTPLPGRCADFSAGCPADTGFLYVHYDRSVSPGVSAICRFSDTEWLIDLTNPTYGLAQSDPGRGFTIVAPPGPAPTYAVGQIPVVRQSILALVNPPNITLWVVQGPPVRQIVTLATGVYSPPLPSDCDANFRRDANGIPNLSSLYRVSIRPLILTQLTGGAAVSQDEIVAAQGTFPMRVFAASLRAFGKLPTDPPRFAVRKCALADAGLSCMDTTPFDVPGVTRMRVFETFRAALRPDDATEYEIVGPEGLAGSVCATPTQECRSLVARNLNTIPAQVNANESYAEPSSEEFSLIKQDLVRQLKVRLDMERKQEEFRVNFL